MEVDLAGRVALVAGPPGAIADAIAAALATNGATVTLHIGFDAPKGAAVDILVTVGSAESELQSGMQIEALCRAVAMGEGGRIVNLVSALGVIPARGALADSATAAAIISLTRTLAMEFGPRGILVNAVAIGALENAGDTELAARMMSHVPVGRAGSLEEVAAAVLFLVDPDNSYTTGHVLTVDGGWSAGFARDF